MMDFLVIGGGIAGVSAGAALSELGRVTVLERETALGYHASGRSAALYEARYGLPTTVALNLASGDAHRAGGYLSDRGLMVIGGAAERAAFETDVQNLGLEPIDIDAARALVPILNPTTVAHVAHHHAAWDLDTDRMIQDCARIVRQSGGTVVTGAEVTSIRRGDHWIVEAGETYEARVLVDAAGAWADTIARMAGIAPIGIQPNRRSMARLPAPGGHDVRGWPMLLGAGESWYAKPDAGAWLVSPAEEHPMDPHDAFADDMVLAEGLARYEEMVTEPVTRMLSNWAGLRSFAPDRALVLGPDPADTSFLWCAGQGGYGFQTAPAASRLLADLASGRASELDAATVAALRPDRLR
jgi:glycine/D-amino acid oxidase-like deaminating enzyme